MGTFRRVWFSEQPADRERASHRLGHGTSDFFARGSEWIRSHGRRKVRIWRLGFDSAYIPWTVQGSPTVPGI